jgi:DNA-directed RNA polymerase specialized sigma subunit
MQHEDVFKYLQQVKNTPYKNQKTKEAQERETSLWSRYQQGDNSVAGSLLKELQPTINSALKSYAGGNEEYNTKAKVLALDAVKSYDPSKGASLNTHIFNSLKKLQRLTADRGNFIHVPEQSALDKRQLEKTIYEYTIDNGEEPSRQQLADLTGLSMNKIDRLLNIKGSTSSSMTTSEQGDSLDRAPRTAIALYEDTLYQELDPTNQKIYDWLTGYKGSPMLSRQEVAQKLKISTAALSQRIAKIDQYFATNGKRIEEVVYGRGL